MLYTSVLQANPFQNNTRTLQNFTVSGISLPCRWIKWIQHMIIEMHRANYSVQSEQISIFPTHSFNIHSQKAAKQNRINSMTEVLKLQFPNGYTFQTCSCHQPLQAHDQSKRESIYYVPQKVQTYHLKWPIYKTVIVTQLLQCPHLQQWT